MAIRLVGATPSMKGSSSSDNGAAARWTCSFVNNMPDGAFEATERQFLDLLDVGSGDEVIEVRRHTMSGIDRDSSISEYIYENYLPTSDIERDPPDLLIVTGSNPIEVDVVAEPYWDELKDLLLWGSKNVSSMLLSCLSAHAALFIFDDIARVRLEEKCTGVFYQNVDETHPLGMGIAPGVLLPHSRINTADVEELRDHGYAIVIESAAVGWGVATKRVGECNLLLVQAHPEYEPSSLLREYRRDARRYVTSQRDLRPVLPYHCVAPEDWDRLKSLQRALSPSEQGVALLDDYPFEDVGARAPWPWRDMAQQLYANWLEGARIEKGDTDA
jgi:homoserine O-succinyltransferase